MRIDLRITHYALRITHYALQAMSSKTRRVRAARSHIPAQVTPVPAQTGEVNSKARAQAAKGLPQRRPNIALIVGGVGALALAGIIFWVVQNALAIRTVAQYSPDGR